MKPRLVVVGAGLGGCFLADALAEKWDVSIVELGAESSQLQKQIHDVGRAAITDPVLGSGLGGTTTIWHNGLMEIEAEIFETKWPFCKSELKKYYVQAFDKLSEVNQKDMEVAAVDLRRRFVECGIPENLLGQVLYYPGERLNMWYALKLDKRVSLIKGEAVSFCAGNDQKISHLVIENDGHQVKIAADLFVLAAGGLGTPLLLQMLADIIDIPSLQQAGLNYEDHPMGFVADFVLNAPIYKLWNFKIPGYSGGMRLPLVVRKNGLLISFQLRPAVHFTPRTRIQSLLNDLRNRPFYLWNYFRIFMHLDDVLDILSFKFGIHMPIKRYALLMVAEQPPASTCSIWRDELSRKIFRKWELSPEYIQTLREAIDQIFIQLGSEIKSINVFPGLEDNLSSAAHHSGAARMHVSQSHGVCDENGMVHGIANLYVCDGSLIPSSGYANTGLTIAALALRMADFLENGRGLR